MLDDEVLLADELVPRLTLPPLTELPLRFVLLPLPLLTVLLPRLVELLPLLTVLPLLLPVLPLPRLTDEPAEVPRFTVLPLRLTELPLLSVELDTDEPEPLFTVFPVELLLTEEEADELLRTAEAVVLLLLVPEFPRVTLLPVLSAGPRPDDTETGFLLFAEAMAPLPSPLGPPKPFPRAMSFSLRYQWLP